MADSATDDVPLAPFAPSRPSLRASWLREGARSALFRLPRWRGLEVTPWTLAWLSGLNMLIIVLTQRVLIDGPANFHWQAMVSNWFGTMLLAWTCYLLRPATPADARHASAPSAVHLFALLQAQALPIQLAAGALYFLTTHFEIDTSPALNPIVLWALWLAPNAWSLLADLVLLWRCSDLKIGPRLLAVALTVAALVPIYAVQERQFWSAKAAPEEAAAPRGVKVTQELMEAQPLLLAQQLDALAPGRAGVVDMYTIGFAPYADEDVFSRESAMVTEVMEKRFDATGRSLQLVNHAATLEKFAWATPLNLRRAVGRVAQTMNPDEDILFLHLTSHGASGGELAADLWPLEIDPLTPLKLRALLDDAGVRYRVISISACYSGSWIAALEDDYTLVVTASDADHTSYGCGRKSPLTFFGRAMYDEQLRASTLSFEQAHAAARTVIKQREEEAGKNDGYSNPQLKMGSKMRAQLELLQQRVRAAP